MSQPDGPAKGGIPPAPDSSHDASQGPSPDGGATLNSASSGVVGEQREKIESKVIGPYRLVQKLGEGGMGQVWLAEQTSPIQRRVAIKLIRSGVSDDALLARFESERQTLALMSHPTIAKVYDAGATPEGTPYFVMEYVPGVPITAYCDEKRLSIRQRLELFLKVCEGVQHAHQKAILHRDLKPANVLVTETDGVPAPHIIDFGIAKSISRGDPLATMFTRAGGFVGTPVYMSPEQADPNVLDVDTRSDVYSLAVILYELLTGALPFDPQQWRSEMLQESLRKIYQQEPPLPSVQYRRKTTTETDTATQTATQRSTRPRDLVSQLAGDLDWITMKGLEHERSRRYGTPIEFGADLRNYLNHEPVSARPASATYRISKYVRRHRIGVSLAAASMLVLIAFSVVQAVELRRITEERDRTARERDRANRIAQFMTSMFKVSDPSEARGNSITAREVLDKASKDINTSLAKDPDMQAQLMGTMGDVYLGLGLYKQAEALDRQALEIHTKLSGPDGRPAISSKRALADVLTNETKFPEAEKSAREAYDSAKRTLGPAHTDTIQTGITLATILTSEGRYSDSEAMDRELLAVLAEVKNPNARDELTRQTQVSLAINLAYQGKFADAEKSFRAAHELVQKKLGPDHPTTLRLLTNIGSILLQQNKLQEAEAIYNQALEGDRRVLGPEHPMTLLVMNNLGLVYRNEKRYGEAETLYRKLVEIDERVLGPENRQTLVAKVTLGDVLQEEMHLREAEKIMREALEAERRVLGPEHSDTLVGQDALGRILIDEGRYAEAEPLFRDELALRTKVTGAHHPDVALTEYNLGALFALQGKKEEAFLHLERFLEDGPGAAQLAQLPEDPHFKSIQTDPRFADILARSKKLSAAPEK